MVTGAAADAMAVLEGRAGAVGTVAREDALLLRAPRAGRGEEGRKAWAWKAMDRKRRLLSRATFIVVLLCVVVVGLEVGRYDINERSKDQINCHA